MKVSANGVAGKPKELLARIDYALDHCPVCSPKTGSPVLCKICLALRNGYWSLGGNMVRTAKGEMTAQEYYESER